MVLETCTCRSKTYLETELVDSGEQREREREREVDCMCKHEQGKGPKDYRNSIIEEPYLSSSNKLFSELGTI